jgi:hypothetical protein
MRRDVVIGSLAVLGVVLLACGGGSSGSSALDLARFDSEAADIYCAGVASCSCGDSSSVADCKTAFRDLSWFDYQGLAYPGSKLDRAAAEKCLADMRAEMQSCSSTNASVFPESCAWVFVGTREVGDSCESSNECGPGLGCDTAQLRCAALAGAGEGCTSTSCQEGLYCNGSNECAALPVEGQLCPDGKCLTGLTCVDVSGTDTCVAPHAVPDSCADGAGCVAGATCDKGTCVALLDEGAECTSSAQCLYKSCLSKKCVGFCHGYVRVAVKDLGAEQALAGLDKLSAPISGAEMAAAIFRGTMDRDSEAAGKEFQVFSDWVAKHGDDLGPSAKKVFEIYKKYADAAKAKGQSSIDAETYIKMVQEMRAAS